MLQRWVRNPLSRSRAFRCFCSELVGTYLLVALVLSSIANATVAGRSGGQNAAGLTSTIGGGLGVLIAVYISYGVSGGQLNPVVTVALFSIGHISLLDVFLYQAAQYLGAFLGAGTVYGLYAPLLDLVDGGQRVAFGANGTALVFVTMPHPQASLGRSLLEQVFTSATFLLAVLAIVDQRNLQTPRYLQPVLIALTVMGITQCTYQLSGTTLNTARDFSPRLLAYMVGYGGDVFSARGFAFWVPLLGPHIGGVLGAWLYQTCFGWALACMHEAESPAKTREEPEAMEATELIGDGEGGGTAEASA